MGRTVINQTENKQTIILNDSPEGVTGGYFDADMVWHDVGSGVVKYSYTFDDLIYVKASCTAVAWTDVFLLNTSSTNRRTVATEKGIASYALATGANEANKITDESNLFPIPIPSDAVKVKVTINTGRYIALNFIKVESGSMTSVYDPGWAESEAEYTLDQSAGYNAIAVSIKYDSAGTSFPSEITDFTVTFER